VTKKGTNMDSNLRWEIIFIRTDTGQLLDLVLSASSKGREQGPGENLPIQRAGALGCRKIGVRTPTDSEGEHKKKGGKR